MQSCSDDLKQLYQKRSRKSVGCEQWKWEKDLRFEAQQRDFQNQLITEQAAHQQVSSTLEGLQQELEVIKSEQNTQNPMDVSSSTDTVSKLNRVKQQAKQEKRSIKERLAKAKVEYE